MNRNPVIAAALAAAALTAWAAAAWIAHPEIPPLIAVLAAVGFTSGVAALLLGDDR